MAVLVTVEFTHPDGALVDTLHDLPEAGVRVLRDAGTDPEHDASVFMFDGVALDTVSATLEADGSVAHTHPMPNYQGMHIFGIEFTPHTELLAPAVTREGGFSLQARRTAPESNVVGWWEQWLFADRRNLNAVWEGASERGFTFEIRSINEFHPEGSVTTGVLTPEQRRTIALASERGYFDEPRQTSIEEIAAELDLSSTAVGGRIRRGVNALVKATIAAEEDGQNLAPDRHP